VSAAPSVADFEVRDRLARVEARMDDKAERDDRMDDLHRRERAESEARVMAEVKASEDRTGKRIDGVLTKVDGLTGKIDTLTVALTTGRSATPANTDDSNAGDGPVFKMSIGRVPPKMWAIIIAALTGAGLVGGGVRAIQEKPAPPVVNVTTSP